MATEQFKFENMDTTIAFVLDKYIDSKSELLSEQAYFAFLKRNNNEEFCHTLALLVQKNGYYNLQALNSHNHTIKRLKLLTKVTSLMNTQFLSVE